MADKTIVTINSYNQNADAFQARFMNLELYKGSLDSLYKHIKDNYNIIDFGCGPGNICKYLLDQNQTINVCGVDLSEKMLELALKNEPRAKYELRDIRNISCYTKNTYNIVVAAFCIPFLYTEETSRFISNITQILKEGGKIYISTMKGSGHRYEWATRKME